MSELEEHFYQILQKYNAGKATPEEAAFIDAYYNAFNLRPDFTDDPENNVPVDLWAGIKQNVDSRIDAQQPVKQTTNTVSYKKWVIAASVILCLGAGAYFITRRVSRQQQLAQNQINDIAPGSNKAILTLANGKTIALNGAKNGVLANQGAMVIAKTADGKIQYQTNQSIAGEKSPLAYNTITTPRGGKYEAVLADGTHFILDASSSIHYPVAFTGHERRVEITGQVYFEVAHNAAMPFRVMVNGETIEDLGTQFNINAYQDETAIKTTLIQGSVKIVTGSSAKIIKPGEQAQVKPGTEQQINVVQADVAEAVAWKNGMFDFNRANIQTIMRQISRWYDVDVAYEGKIPTSVFTGELYRSMTASKMLEGLTAAKVHFRIEGKKIIISP